MVTALADGGVYFCISALASLIEAGFFEETPEAVLLPPVFLALTVLTLTALALAALAFALAAGLLEAFGSALLAVPTFSNEIEAMRVQL